MWPVPWRWPPTKAFVIDLARRKRFLALAADLAERIAALVAITRRAGIDATPIRLARGVSAGIGAAIGVGLRRSPLRTKSTPTDISSLTPPFSAQTQLRTGAHVCTCRAQPSLSVRSRGNK